MTTNDLTKDFIIAATAAFPDALMWRNNRLSADIVKNGKKRHIEAGINGQGDITASIPVRFGGRRFGVRFEIEIKNGKDRQSLIQKAFEAALRRSGGIYLIVRETESGISALKSAVAFLESE